MADKDLTVGDVIQAPGTDTPQIVGPDGQTLGLGLQLPPEGFVSALPVFEDAVEPLPAAKLEEIAKGGQMDARRFFDESWIGNQRSHGSCNGFAGAKALQRARVRRGLERVELSGAYLYSLINGGRDQGSMLDDGMQALLSRGCATEATVPWNAIYPGRYDRQRADAEAAKHRAFECYFALTIPGFLTGLALGFDGVCAVHVGQRFMQVGPDGVPGADAGPGNHAVGCDGLVWERGGVKAVAYNSWGTTWGRAGRMLLDEAHFSQPFVNHRFYLIRTSTD